MQFTIERDVKRKCWYIYDHREQKPMKNPPVVVTLADSVVENMLGAYCFTQGAVDKLERNNRYEH